MIKLYYKYEHDALERWAWINYILNQHTLKRNFLLNHPEAYFEITPIQKKVKQTKHTNKITNEDEFTINILKTLKNKFDEDIEYPGKLIRLEINNMILRVK